MKAIALWTVVLWFALAAEQTRPDLLPVGSIVIPSAVGCMLWQRSASGVVVAGATMLLSWILAAAGPPLEIGVVLLLTARFITNSASSHRYEGGHAAWLHPLAIVVLGEIVLTGVGAYDAGLRAMTSAVVPRLVAAIPCTLLIVFVLRMSEELGFRRTVSI